MKPAREVAEHHRARKEYNELVEPDTLNDRLVRLAETQFGCPAIWVWNTHGSLIASPYNSSRLDVWHKTPLEAIEAAEKELNDAD